MVGRSGTVRDRRLAPAAVQSIVVDEEKHAMDVVVDENEFPWRSAGAARTCASRASSRAGRSTS
jgi:hypothetical protein